MTARRLALTGAVLACTAIAPASAAAATLVNSGGTLTYTATASANAVLSVGQVWPSTTTVAIQAYYPERDPVVAIGCTPPAPNAYTAVYTCEGVSAVKLTGGPGDDSIGAGGLQTPASIDGGAGNDDLEGGKAATSIIGGPGDDRLYPAPGNTVSGGSGDDIAYYIGWGDLEPLSLSLDGYPNDGLAGEGTNLLPDIENLAYLQMLGDTYTVGDDPPVVPQSVADRPITLTGSDAANGLTGGEGNDVITGGGGADTLTGAGGDDTFYARDGFADRVACGAGTDAAIVDQFDQVGESCESVQVAEVGNGLEDRPPAVNWTAPGAGSRLTADRATGLQVTSFDDRGIVRVQFLDDDRVVCTDTEAPYTCAYQPRAADVGRNTLVAVATDTTGQTSSAVRAVTVGRFVVKSVSLRVTKRGSRYTATGKVTLPKGLRCSGSVAVAAKAGSKTLRTRTAKLSRTCTFRVVLSVSGHRKPRFTATYAGTDEIAPKRSPARSP